MDIKPIRIKDAGSEYEVRQGRSGNWAVFKKGDDLPDSQWFTSRSKAAEYLRAKHGASVGKTKVKKEEVEPVEILGYPWEYIQALQHRAPASELNRILREQAAKKNR